MLSRAVFGRAIKMLFSSFEKGQHEAEQIQVERATSWPPKTGRQGAGNRDAITPHERKALDRWIKADGGLLSRQQAIRRILSIALGASRARSEYNAPP